MMEKVKQTDSVGKGPQSGWQFARLGDICEIIAGQSPPGSTYRNTAGGLPFFQGKADFGLIHPVPRVWCIETKIRNQYKSLGATKKNNNE